MQDRLGEMRQLAAEGHLIWGELEVILGFRHRFRHFERELFGGLQVLEDHCFQISGSGKLLSENRTQDCRGQQSGQSNSQHDHGSFYMSGLHVRPLKLTGPRLYSRKQRDATSLSIVVTGPSLS